MDRKLLLGLISLATAASFAAHIYRANQPAYTPRQSAQEASEYKGAFEWLRMMRGNLLTGQVEPSDFFNMQKAVNAYVRGQSKSADYQWVEMGPDNVGGRVRAITIDPLNHQKVWCGSVSGGLWKSLDGGNTWENIPAFSVNLCVSSIAILGNGHLYVATGSAAEGPGGGGGSGFVGNGIFMSDNDGATWSHPLAPPAAWNANSDWATNSRIKPDPTNSNRLWIASSNPGLRLYDETTSTVSTPTFTPSNTIANQPASDVDVSADGQTVVAVVGNRVCLSADGGQNFSQLATNAGVGFPSTGFGRLEMAISPDDANYIYALACTSAGKMSGVWSSTDRGNTWIRVWPPDYGVNAVPALDIFSSTHPQGYYDCAIGVRPGHPDEVWVGGVDLWKYTLSGVPEQLAPSNLNFPGCFFCVHSDEHEITFADANTAYIGCDGGVYRTPSAGASWNACNRFLNITQFYSVAYNSQGHTLGGAQDNGTQLVYGYGNTSQEAVSVGGGDGFDAELSQLDTNIIFTTVYFGSLDRSNDGGNNSGSFYDAGISAVATPSVPPLGDGLGDFYTNIRLHENGHDLNSIDSVKKVFHLDTLDRFAPGETRAVGFHGGISSVEQYGSYTNTTADTIIGPWDSDTLIFQDRVTSLFVAGFGGSQGVWVTRGAENFNENPSWASVCSSDIGNVNCLEWSGDGNHLFIGTTGGSVYRVSGFNNARTIAQMSRDSSAFALSPVVQILSGGATITGMGPDLNDGNRLIVTFGGYGGSQKVKRSTNALSASPTFQNIWNVPTALQGMPLYDCMIDQSNSNIMLVGSEFGVWATDDGGSNWSNQTNGIPGVPVFGIRQQTMNYATNPIGPDWITNNGVIYVGSHGRGFFRTDALLGIKPIAGHPNGSALDGLTVAPNPTSTQSIITFTLAQAGDVTLNVFDLNGALVRTISRKNLAPLEQHIPVNVEDLNNGTYIVDVRSGTTHRAARMVVAR